MKAANEAISTDNPTAVTFDTLTAAKELRKTGLEDQQAEAIVATISKAMSETVATKSDIELLSATTKSEIQELRIATKSDMDSFRAEIKADIGALRSEMKIFEQSVDSRFEKVDLRFQALEKSMVTLQDKIVIKLGALMVTMTFLLLAIGPFYFRWVMSLMGSS